MVSSTSHHSYYQQRAYCQYHSAEEKDAASHLALLCHAGRANVQSVSQDGENRNRNPFEQVVSPAPPISNPLVTISTRTSIGARCVQDDAIMTNVTNAHDAALVPKIRIRIAALSADPETDIDTDNMSDNKKLKTKHDSNYNINVNPGANVGGNRGVNVGVVPTVLTPTITSQANANANAANANIRLSLDDCDNKSPSLAPAPFFFYRDHSRSPDDDPLTPLTAPGRVPNFPAKMHAILSRPDLSDVVAWLPHGRSWRVLKPREFEIRVVPTYFEHSKFSSFIRQANGWGFRRITQGRDRNSYYNALFLRGLPHLCKKMRRPGVNQKPTADPEHEPDFSKISRIYPLPETTLDDEYIMLECTLKGGPKARMPVSFNLNFPSSLHAMPQPFFTPTNHTQTTTHQEHNHHIDNNNTPHTNKNNINTENTTSNSTPSKNITSSISTQSPPTHPHAAVYKHGPPYHSSIPVQFTIPHPQNHHSSFFSSYPFSFHQPAPTVPNTNTANHTTPSVLHVKENPQPHTPPSHSMHTKTPHHHHHTPNYHHDTFLNEFVQAQQASTMNTIVKQKNQKGQKRHKRQKGHNNTNANTTPNTVTAVNANATIKYDSNNKNNKNDKNTNLIHTNALTNKMNTHNTSNNNISAKIVANQLHSAANQFCSALNHALAMSHNPEFLAAMVSMHATATSTTTKNDYHNNNYHHHS